ncbi:MAG: POTRA domain-containing protein [Chitinophagaceae bacterium]
MYNKGKKYYLAITVCLLLQMLLYAQPGTVEMPYDNTASLEQIMAQTDTSTRQSLFIISEIFITGDRKTKSYIIEREIPFKRGDSLNLTALVNKFDMARRQLMNTRLFNDVTVSLKGFKGYLVDIQVDVKERWYLFPIPYIKPVDRNLAEWAKQGYGLQRVNYGAKLSFHNFTGRNDKLKLWFITGYTRQIQFSYEQPNADKSLKHGYGINVSYATAKEINHQTENNEQQFIPFDNSITISDLTRSLFKGQILNEQVNVAVSYSYRPAIRTRHLVRLSYNKNRIDDVVAVINPKYFNNGKLNLSYPELSYAIEYNNIDFIAYPLKGFIGDVSIARKGINADMNMWQLNAKGLKGWQLARKSYFGIQGNLVVKLPFDQPYYNHRLFGYGDLYLRGLENYVIDGVAAVMIRNTFRSQIAKFNLPIMFSKSHDHIPFRMFLKAYGDMGYSHNANFPQNSLVNRMLYTAGAGIDIVTLYDVAFRFEYSFNQLGQKGLFLHFKNDF